MVQDDETTAARAAGASRLTRPLWLALGCLMVVLGIFGALLPLMPTTIFLILAAGCFARSSPRLEAALLRHPRFGPSVLAWRREGAIPRRAKLLAGFGMATGYAIFWWTMRPAAALALGVGFGMMLCAAFVLTRPDGTSS